MLACLEEHRHEEDFSDRCRGPLDGKMERESADYELNAGLRCVAASRCATLGCPVLCYATHGFIPALAVLHSKWPTSDASNRSLPGSSSV